MTTIASHIRHASGIPLGGIGTGSVEIQPDGLLHDWQIFNLAPWAPGSEKCFYSQDTPALELFSERLNESEQKKRTTILDPLDLIFVARVKLDGCRPVVRYLALEPELAEVFVAPWKRPVQAIEYVGEFPYATLKYRDPSLMVEISAAFFSSFIPGDEKSSGIPGFYVDFHICNTTNLTAEVSILGVMKNPASTLPGHLLVRHQASQVGEARFIEMCGANVPEGAPNAGDMTVGVTGGATSQIALVDHNARTADRFLWGPWGSASASYYFGFRESGELRNSDRSSPLAALYGTYRPTMSAGEKQALLNEVLTDPLVKDFYDRIARHNLDDVKTAQFTDDFLNFILIKSPTDWPKIALTGWDAVLCSRHVLAAGQSAQTLFTVSWFYPNHYSPRAGNIGHMYENWFSGSLDVAHHLMANYKEIRQRTDEFRRCLHDSTIGLGAVEAISAQLTCFIKTSWWVKEGIFAIWEGLGSCGLHTTDVSFYATYPIIAMFPELEKRMILQEAAVQRADGRVHHYFVDDFYHVDTDAYERVDMNPQFVLMAYRDYVWTGDHDFLRRVWPMCVAAMANTALLDCDGDGLPDRDCQHQTYDTWDFDGSPAYVDSLWISALACYVEMADALGQPGIDHWRKIRDQAQVSFNRLLWNGEYYSLWVDPASGNRDETLMTDQLAGEAFLRLNGLNPLLTDDRVRQVLKQVFGHNFLPDEGLLNATSPVERTCGIQAYQSFHATTVWSGVEYLMAAFLMRMGMTEPAFEVIDTVVERYRSTGKVWRHMECGENYYRPMSAWSILNAASGMTWSGVDRRLTFAPAVAQSGFRCLFAVPGCWGVFHRNYGLGGKADVIEVRQGCLKLDQLVLSDPGTRPRRLSVRGDDLGVEPHGTAGFYSFALQNSLELGAGASLQVDYC